MARRRFVPSIDGLEVRELMSSTATMVPAAASAPAATSASSPDATVMVPIEIQTLRNQRIEKLRQLFFSTDSHRPIPSALISSLQNDLRAIKGQLHPPSSAILTEFNHQLRGIIASSTLSPETAVRLNHLFGAMLESSNAHPSVISQFQNDMLQLARIDSTRPNAGNLVANDYALIAQLSMGVGIQMKTVTGPNGYSFAILPKNSTAWSNGWAKNTAAWSNGWG